jgi:RNA polymerase sigma-70 factor (ECF subfamily)
MKREIITSKKTKEMSVGRMVDPATGVGLQDVLQQLLAHESDFRVFVRRRLSDGAMAEDVLQESLMRAVERQHTLQQRENVVGWFYHILRNAIVDVYRSRATESKKTGTFLQELIAAGEDKTPALDELRPTVCACLQRLLPNIRPAYAELLQRVDLKGQSVAAVAQELQVTPNNLTVRLHRARQALRTSLEKSCGLCTKHGCLNCTCD